MKSFLSIACVGVVIALSSLPASAREVTGPRGNSASRSTIVVPNRVGGYNISGQGSFKGVNGATGNRQVLIHTNGQRSVVYGGTSNVTTSNGKSATINTSGSAIYNLSSGYYGHNTTTINGTTYNANTQNRVTTITSPSGTRTIDYTLRQ